MKAMTLKEWEGFSSLAWTLLGFGVFQYWTTYHGFHSLVAVVLGVLILWWGVGLTLAISGLRSRSQLAALAAKATIVGFLCFWGVLFFK